MLRLPRGFVGVMLGLCSVCVGIIEALIRACVGLWRAYVGL